MIIANQLSKTNRAEYLLYMWQVEDLLRAYNCDAEKIRQEYVSRFQLDDEQRTQTEYWYASLCDMMLYEGVREKGHLQINKNTLVSLEEVHKHLLASDEFPYYKGFYNKVLPHIVALRKKGAAEDHTELQICFDALYGILMLRLKNQEISEKTKQAQADITQMLGQLSEYYFKLKEEGVF